MKLAKVRQPDGSTSVVQIQEEIAIPLELERVPGITCLADILAADNPEELVKELTPRGITLVPLSLGAYLSPVDQQEIWAAGVTYKRSKIAREEESAGAAQFYDKVYTAERPELFMKATPARVVHPGDKIRVRADSKWNVPEPELTLVITKDLRIVGYTIGNDVSSRDIEGENPLYLPQAKVYNQCCSLGPCILLADGPLNKDAIAIDIVIYRKKAEVFKGSTVLGQMKRELPELAEWLGKENDFPAGAFLLTGTGVVPPDNFTLENGDAVSITITGIGTLTNPVAKD